MSSQQHHQQQQHQTFPNFQNALAFNSAPFEQFAHSKLPSASQFSAQFGAAAQGLPPQWSAAQLHAQLPHQLFAQSAAQLATPQWSAHAFQSPDLASKWSSLTQNSHSAAAAFQQPHASYGQFPQLSAAQVQAAHAQLQHAPQFSAAHYGFH